MQQNFKSDKQRNEIGRSQQTFMFDKNKELNNASNCSIITYRLYQIYPFSCSRASIRRIHLPRKTQLRRYLKATITSPRLQEEDISVHIWNCLDKTYHKIPDLWDCSPGRIVREGALRGLKVVLTRSVCSSVGIFEYY